MVDERESPSAGWREVYDEMAADPNVEEATRPCPDCGRHCENVLRDVYECEDHGVFRASASDDGGEESDAEADARDAPDDDAPDESYEAERRARGPAD